MEMDEAVGLLWLAARTQNIVKNIIDPTRRPRDAARCRERSKAAREEINELEMQLDAYVYSSEEVVEMEINDPDCLDDLLSDNSWEPIHERLLEVCRRSHLRSRYDDPEWEPIYA